MTKRVVIYPFFSQQDKRTGRFLLSSCGSTKMNLFLAERIALEFDAEVMMVLPENSEGIAFSPKLVDLLKSERFTTFWTSIPSNNLWQRLTWKPETWEVLFRQAHLVINHHEVLGWPLKSLFPDLKVIQMNVIRPEEPWPWMAPLFYETWKAVDLMVALGIPMLKEIAQQANNHSFQVPNLSHWPLSFDAEALDVLRSPEKDIDLLFVLRGSATNYSHHKEFLRALILLRAAGFKGKVAFTDITRYMVAHCNMEQFENIEILPEPKTQADYVRMLWRSKAVIALNDNLHGGMSFREAIHCGACPIASRTPGYVDLLGTEWPYFVDPVTSERIAGTILFADRHQYWESITSFQRRRIHSKVEHESFQNAWERIIKADIAKLLGV